MTGNTMLERYVARSNGSSNAGGSTEPDFPSDSETEDLGPFGYIRGATPPIALELRKRDGLIMAIGYSWFERMVFNPSKGIILHAGEQQIIISGRNLNGEIRPGIRLFQGLTRHRINWVREADQGAILQADAKAVTVESIAY